MSGNRLEGRVVVVTGGGSGIGRGTCLEIAGQGARVVVADIRAELAEQVAAEITQSGATAMAVHGDISDEADVERIVAATVDRFGGLYGMVANAGTSGRGWVHETSLEDWRAVLRVNLDGAFLCAKHALPHMIAAGTGSYVVTSSVAGMVVAAGQGSAAYATSKHAVLGLMKQIAVDYAEYGIRANAILPSMVGGTNMYAHTMEDLARSDPTATRPLPRPTPWLLVDRPGKAREEYGATIAFLLSDDSGYITGTAIPVDGGYLAT